MDAVTQKVEIERVILERAEGPKAMLSGPIALGGIESANQVLRRWSDSAPKEAVDKVDFEIRWVDGSAYRGTYGLKHWSVEMPCLEEHVRNELAFAAGRGKPAWMREDAYQIALARGDSRRREQCGELLDGYALGPEKPASRIRP